MTDPAKDTRLGIGYTLPDELGMVRGVHRQPRLAGGAVVTENGTLASDDFATGVSGWSIDGDGDVEFNSGTFRGTVAAGSVVAGGITVQSGGNLSSANYVADTSGWKIDGTGTAEFNSVKVRGSITSGGALQSSNFSANSAGWKVDGAGTAEFNSVKVRGTITSGGTLASANYSAGSAGWQIAGSGAAEFENVTVRGTVATGGTLASPNFSAGSTGWSIAGSGAAEFNNVTVRGDVHAASFVTNTTGGGGFIQIAAGFGDEIVFSDGSTSGIVAQQGGRLLVSSNSFIDINASTKVNVNVSKFVVNGDQWIQKSGGSGLRLQSSDGAWWLVSVTTGGAISVSSSSGP